MSGVRHASVKVNPATFSPERKVTRKSMLDEMIEKKKREAAASSAARAKTLSSSLKEADVAVKSESSRTAEESAVQTRITEMFAAQNKRIEAQGERLQADIAGLGFEQGRIRATLEDYSLSQSLLEGEFRDLRSVLDGIAKKETQKENIARCLIKNAQALISSLEKLNPERYAKGELDVLKGKLQNSVANFDSKIYEGALVMAQTAIADGMGLKEKIASISFETEKLLAEANSAIAELQGRFDQADALEYEISTSDGIETVPALVDVFSDGRLSENKSKLCAVLKSLDKENISQEELKRVIDDTNEIRIAHEEALLAAYTNYLKACEREELLDVSGRLIESFYGMDFIDAAYYGGNDGPANSAIHAKFESRLAGDEIVFVIRPNKDANGVVVGESIELHFTQAGNETRSATIDRRSSEIIQAINDNATGLKVQSSVCDESTKGKLSPSKHVGDMDKVRRGVAND
ncbi:MAG: hypothetical protein LBT59_16340 [Clostridiales bacterium]|jgi:hypothetical protein|nr:hypothetical protein [Clostridiales bacterium]